MIQNYTQFLTTEQGLMVCQSAFRRDSVRTLPLAFFDLDGPLVDRQTATLDAISVLCQRRRYSAAIEQRLRADLIDRANPSDFTRLQDTFGLETSGADLWQEYVDLMSSAVSC